MLGTARRADEGAAAHVWQLLKVGQCRLWRFSPSSGSQLSPDIPDGRDLSRCTGGDGNAVMREFGLDAQTPLIGMAARFTPMKGQDTFLQMASIVAKKMPAARFLLVGADEAASGGRGWTAQMQELGNQLGLDGKVIFAGYRHDMPNVLAAMGLLRAPQQERRVGERADRDDGERRADCGVGRGWHSRVRRARRGGNPAAAAQRPTRGRRR